jgi:hypothetical protein
MTIRKVEIERLSVKSSKPFEVVVAALEAVIGHPDMVEFVKATQAHGPLLNWKVRFIGALAGRG